MLWIQLVLDSSLPSSLCLLPVLKAFLVLVKLCRLWWWVWCVVIKMIWSLMSSLKLFHNVFFLLWIVMHTVVGEQKCILLPQNRLFKEDLKPVWISFLVCFNHSFFYAIVFSFCFVYLVPVILFCDICCVEASKIEKWMISCLTDSIFISVIIT